jgi:hypothetical protein
MGKCREGGRGEREMERTSQKDNILAASQVGPWGPNPNKFIHQIILVSRGVNVGSE